jgi:hypothetical protein
VPGAFLKLKKTSSAQFKDNYSEEHDHSGRKLKGPKYYCGDVGAEHYSLVYCNKATDEFFNTNLHG